ncbi:MAG: hypothetical protein IKW74_03610, partial [Thermoguttaceae bacterium]|nr:hypothetical protein [Thermoguttaceae bacterium]
QLKQRKISVRIFLPSLEWLQQVNRLMIRFSVLFLGLGILSGVYISHVVRLTGDPVSAFSDPMILGALILFFVLASTLLFSSTSFFSDGRRVALLTVVGFLFLVIVLLAGLFCSQAHWYLMSAPVIPVDSPVVSGKPETGSIPTSEPAAEQRGRTDNSLNPGIDSSSEGRP